MKKIRQILFTVLVLLFLLTAACGKEEQDKKPDIVNPVEEIQREQDVINEAQEADRQLEEQLEEIPLE